MTAEVSGVMLGYVARKVTGKVMVNKTRFDDESGENVISEVAMKEPVIVFFPNKTCQVFERKIAEQRGFLQQPQVMNLAQVEDTHTAAGRYKSALRDSDRLQAWLDMENAIVTGCISSTGHPLDIDGVRYSDKSMYFTENVKSTAKEVA
jgi:hypothetical protein